MSVPFYRHSFQHAQSVGCENEYYQSLQENRRCREYIESPETGVMSQAYQNYVVDRNNSYMKSVIKKFGMERTMYVFAATVKCHEHDGRISPEVKEWAENFCAEYCEEIMRGACINQVNPGIVDILAKSVIKEYKAKQDFKTEKTGEIRETNVEETPENGLNLS